MTIANYYKKISERTGVSLDIVKKVIAEEQELLFEIVATNDNINLKIGKIYGTDKTPRRISGSFRDGVVRANHGWSKWRTGVPKIKFSGKMLDCEVKPTQEYFELPEHKFTSLARIFRKEFNLPEIPEFEGKTEEEIKAITDIADKEELAGLSKTQIKRQEINKRNALTRKKAEYKYWTSLGYIPRGILYDEMYDGEVRDAVDNYIRATFNLAKTLPEKLDEVLYAQELAEYLNKKEEHQELFDLEKKLRKDIESLGQRPLIHKKRKINNVKDVHYFQNDLLIWQYIEKAALAKKSEIEYYANFFKELGIPEEEIERYVYRKQVRKVNDVEELEEERLRQKLALENSLDVYNLSTVIDVRDTELNEDGTI